MRTGSSLRRFGTGLVSLGLMVGIGTLPAAASAASTSRAVTTSAVKVRTFTPTLTNLGTVNLSRLAAAAAAKAPAGTTSRFRAVGNRTATLQPKGASTLRAPSSIPIGAGNVAGESGFVGITGVEQAVANGHLDLEPPDQGLCAGQGVVAEFVNNAFSVYTPAGIHLLPVIPSFALFNQPSTAFFSDPRCHYDALTQRWFLIEFIVGSATSPSLQFIDVSNTSDPTGTYTIWAIDTTDVSNPGCPCFGDFDQLGVDDNGIYISTDEFPDGPGAFKGTVIYAVSKELLETFANTGIPPVPVGYRLTHDAFGAPSVVSPASTPPGARFATNTEYFVESNGNALADNHLIVYALRNTSLLAQPGVPSLFSTEVTTEPYSFPPNATQMPGPSPLGRSVQDPLGQLEADFDAVMQTTYVGGNLFAELDTGTASGRDAAAWFVLNPSLSPGGTLTAPVAAQGYVAVASASLIYPAIAVNQNGFGFLAFALSGPSNHPSAAYVPFDARGPYGSVHIAAAGAATEDSFTCYAAFVGPNFGGCRWGDYSAAVAMGGKIYLATEMIPASSRDLLTNWGTFVWSAPPVPPPPGR